MLKKWGPDDFNGMALLFDEVFVVVHQYFIYAIIVNFVLEEIMR